ncbi:MAG: hypothetical protein ACT4OJ_16445 [Bacteroidota bacterium]
MDHYLFTDGTSEVKEAHSKEELLSLINSSAAPGHIRVWAFNSNEWMDYTIFLKHNPGFSKTDTHKTVNGAELPVVSPGKGRSWVKRSLLMAGAAAAVLLVFNFTSARWEKGSPLKTQAPRPENVPVMDIDSMITEIEWQRGKTIDKGTRYNLRMRNNWPEHILLYLNAEKEVKGSLSRFFNISVSIDNSTGFVLDNAQVQLQVWENGKPAPSDTLQFSSIRYDKVLVRQLAGVYRADSISVSFRGIRAGAFNFCYSASIKNNSGNHNDKWFCRDGKTAE